MPLIKSDIHNLLAAMIPGGIEASEAQGQRELCASTHLPIEINGGYTWEDIEKHWGIERGPIVDKIFYSVNLPDGWKLQPTDHSMWSKLIDADGCERAAIFFKAAFYDFKAHLSLSTRYRMKWESSEGETHQCRNLVVDARPGEVLFTGPWSDFSGSYKAPTAFLDERYPDHNNPFAYW